MSELSSPPTEQLPLPDLTTRVEDMPAPGVEERPFFVESDGPGLVDHETYWGEEWVSRAIQDEAPEYQESVRKFFDTEFTGQSLPIALGSGNFNDNSKSKLRQFFGIFKANRNLAHEIVDSNILGFTGTSSAALPGILRQGAILSQPEALRRGEALSTGERTFSAAQNTDQISFADWRAPDTINEYATGRPQSYQDMVAHKQSLQEQVAEMEVAGKTPETSRQLYNAKVSLDGVTKKMDKLQKSPDSSDAQLIMENFPIAFGLSGDGYQVYERLGSVPEGEDAIASAVGSDARGEFMVTASEIPLDRIPLVLVPREKVAYVRELLAQSYPNIRVNSLDDVVERYS